MERANNRRVEIHHSAIRETLDRLQAPAPACRVASALPPGTCGRCRAALRRSNSPFLRRRADLGKRRSGLLSIFMLRAKYPVRAALSTVRWRRRSSPRRSSSPATRCNQKLVAIAARAAGATNPEPKARSRERRRTPSGTSFRWRGDARGEGSPRPRARVSVGHELDRRHGNGAE